MLEIALHFDEFFRLRAAYSEPHRVYHTLQHVSECLRTLDWLNSLIHIPNVAWVEMALWYHDAIYQPGANDNEQKSADWATDFLQQRGVTTEKCEMVYSLIMATGHNEIPTQQLCQIVADIDLSILGTPISRFDEYEKQIREEYHKVDWLIYTRERIKILQGFLNRTRIYHTPTAYSRFEKRARKNLRRSIAKLET